jgi:beta-lactamase regulating signal transducer with metallopeptidase domain
VSGSIGTVWMVVAGMILLWTFGCHAVLLLLRRRCAPVEDADARVLMAELCEQMKVRQPLLLSGPWVRGPFLDGLVRPAILLPRSYRTDFPDGALRAVLAHELVHLARGDCWWNLLFRVTCALGWMHPLLWLLHRRLEQASEEACDQAVLYHGCSAREYARCLTDLAERLLPTVPARVAGATVLPYRSGLGRRVERILLHTGAQPIAPGGGTRLGVWGGMAVAVSVVMTLVSAMPAASADGPRIVGLNSDAAKASLAGRVLHEDGSPAAKVKIFATLTPEPSERRLGTFGLGETKADGSYRIQGVEPGEFQVFVSGPSTEWAAASVKASARVGEPGKVPDLILTPGSLIRGQVVDDNGKPLEGLYVRTEGPDQPENGLATGNLKTDVYGRFQLRVSPGRTALWVVGPVDWSAVPANREPPVRKTEVVIAKGETKEVVVPTDAHVFADGAVTGHVLFPNGKPAAGIRVMAQLHEDHYRGGSYHQSDGSFSWSEDISRADGSYRLTGLMSAPYNVSVEDPKDQWIDAAAKKVIATQRRTVHTADLILTHGAFVAGTVTDEATGKPLAGVPIGSYGPHRPRSSAMIIRAVTDAKGRYRLRVAPGESYIYVQDPRYGEGLDATITLAEGETHELPFRVKAVPPDPD